MGFQCHHQAPSGTDADSDDETLMEISKKILKKN